MKKVWLIKILKTFGICLASIIGAVALTGGVMYLVGALNPKKVELTNMSFVQKAYVLDGVSISENGEVSSSNYDSTIKLVPENEDATELDIKLSNNGTSIARLVTFNEKNEPVETDNGKVGSNLVFDLTNSLGGTFDLTASQDFLTASTKVFVDLPLESFNISSSLNNDYIYPGTNFTISLSNCKPATYLRKPSASNTAFYSIYGENYFNKSPIFFSSNESIATVDKTTGEITVLDEGEFTIYVYVPKTFKLNANMPKRGNFLDAESYFNTLGNFCAFEQKTFVSKSIEIGSITSSSEVHNINVFKTYKYSFNDLYQNTDNQLPLNIKIHVPTGTSFSDSDLDYRAKDLEIYEGVYDSETSSYSILPFVINQETGERISEHFKISKTYQKYPYWEITPIDDYSASQNFCLIAVINDDPDKVIDGNSQIDITETNKFHFGAVKVVSTSISGELSLEKRDYLLSLKIIDIIPADGINATYEDGTIFDLGELNFEISPTDASYKRIAFFVDPSTPDGVLSNENSTEIKPETEGENEGKILIKAKGTGVAYINAVIVKTKNSANGEIYYSDEENTQVVEMSNRVRIKLVITSNINFANFDVNGISNEDKTKANDELTGFKVTKGRVASLVFNSSADLLTVYNQGLFKVYTSAETDKDTEKISIDVKKLGVDSEISLTGINSGTTTLYLELNENIVKQFSIQVISDAIKSISLEKDNLPLQNLEITLDCNSSESNKSMWSFGGSDSAENYQIEIVTDRESQKLTNLDVNCSVGNDILSIEVSKDYTTLQITPLKKYDGIITLSVSTQNSDNETIYSTNTLRIEINTPNISFERNYYDNTTTIIGKTYEKVVSGEKYDILKQNNGEKYILEAKADNINVGKLFTIKEIAEEGKERYKDYTFNGEPNSNILVEFKLSTNFGVEEKVYVLILPKYQLTTTTISSNEQEITLDKNNVSVYENTYDSTNNIKPEKIDSDVYTINYMAVESTKGTLSGNTYKKPELIFESGYDIVLVKVTIEGIELAANLNIELTAGVNLTAKDEANNLYAGEIIELSDLIQLNGTVSGYSFKITNVTNLPAGITYESGKLKIDEGFHDLTANILIDVEIYQSNGLLGDSLVYTYSDYNLTLNIAYYELFLNEDYLVNENTLILLTDKYFALEGLILSATKTSVDGIEDAKENVKFYNSDNVELTTINSANSITAKIVINGNGIISKSITIYKQNNLLASKSTIYETITYSVSNLINITDKNYEAGILSSAEILGCEATLSEEPVKNNLLTIKEYAGSEIKVQFKILGQIVSFEYKYEKLLIVEDKLTLYSNTQKELFDKKSDVNYIVQLQYANGDESELEKITLENNTLLKIGAISNTITFNVVIQTKANGYEGGTFEIEVTANPISISQNKTEIIDGYQYNLTDLITISGSNLPAITYSGLTIDNGSVKVSNNKNEQIQVKLTVGDLTLKSFTFNVICVEISISNLPSFYQGQVLDRNTLLSYINLTSAGSFVNSYKSLVAINDSLDDFYSITIGSNTAIKYSLGDNTEIITIEGKVITYTNGNGYYNNNYVTPQEYNVYSGTTISNYVQVGYLNGINFIYLNDLLRFELVESNTNSALIKNLATDFETTGKFTLNKNVNGKISIKVTLNGVENNEKTIIFNIATLNKKEEYSTSSLKLGVGVSSVDISENTYFYKESQIFSTSYEFENISIVGTTSSQYLIAKANGKFVILKDGVSVASLENNPYSKYSHVNSNLTLASSLDSMEITICGYLNVNIDGLTCESTKEEFVTLIISLTKINVSMQTSKTSNYVVSKKMIGTSEFNQIEGVTDSAIELSHPNSEDILIATNPNSGDYQTFTKLEIKNAFVCDSNGNALYQQGDSSGFAFNSTTITLPILVEKGHKLVEQVITLGNIDNKTSWQLTFNSTLINFVALTLSYEVNDLQAGEINVLLSPTNYLTNITSKTSSAFYYVENNEEDNTIVSEERNVSLLLVSKQGAVYARYDIVEVNNVSKLQDVEIYYSYYSDDGTQYYGQSSKYECDFYDDSSIYINIGTSEDSKSKNMNYFLVTNFGETNKEKYYFPLTIQEIDVETRVSKTNGTGTQLIKISSETPLTISSVLADNENTLDLKEYVYFKTQVSDYTCIISSNELLKRLSFTEVSGDTYSVSSEGILTIKNTISGLLEIKFSVCGMEYSLYLKGIEINLNYNGNNTLNAGKTYFMSSRETSAENVTSITTTLSENSPTGECKDYISFENFSYTYGTNKVTEQTLFDIDNTNNRIVVSYAGETLGIFTKIGNYYQISNLVGGFGFEVVTQYKESINRTKLGVSSTIITTNYISPSIVNGREYQNILSNTSTNLNNLINCENTLTFSLCEYNNNVSITNSNLIIDAVTSELLLKIKAEAGEIVEYYYVRVIPENKITLANNNKQFNVIKGDTINLTDFIKIEEFSKLDSQNNPVYVPNLNCYYTNENCEQKCKVTNPLSYAVADTFNITFSIDGLKDTLTFNAVEITPASFGTLSCYIGENLDIKSEILNVINANNISLTPVLSFSNDNNDISSNGVFRSVVANPETKVKVTINNLTLFLEIEVNDFELEPEYLANSYYVTTNDAESRYANVYATQSLDLTKHIKVLTEYKTNLNFELTSSSLSSYTIEDIANKIIYKVNGIKIFEIDNASYILNVFNSLNDLTLTNNELLITLNCGVSVNDCKSCQLNLRLMKTELTFTKANGNEPTDLSNPYTILSDNLIEVAKESYYFDLKNVAQAQTTCSSDNIYLTNELSYVLLSGAGEISNTHFIKLKKVEENYLNYYDFQIQAILGSGDNIISKVMYLNLNFISDDVTIKESEISESKINGFSFKETKFVKTAEDKTILSSGAITAIYSEDYLVTFKKPDGEIFNAYYISQNGKNIMWISSTGTFEILVANYHDIKLKIEAKSGSLFVLNEISFVESKSSNNFTQNEFAVTEENIYEYENGIKYYVLYSNIESTVNSSMGSYNFNNEIVKYENSKFLANVSEITYVRVEAKNNNNQSYFINFKIYPTTINKLYTEDFTLISDIDVDNDDTALQKNANYKTLYVYENADATQTMNTFNLNDYFAVTSNGKTFSKLSYEVVGTTYLSTEKNKFIVDNSICSLSEGVLTINQTKTISYIGIKVKFGEDEKTYRFRIMPLKLEQVITSCTNYSSVNLSDLCTLTAQSEKSLTNSELLTNATDISLTSELIFEVTSGTSSKIEGNKLVISEIENNVEIQLEVSFNNTILGTITLTISNTLGDYLLNNVYYEEFFDESYKNENTISRQYVISNASSYEIEKIIVNGVEYIEKEIEKVTENKVTTYYLSFTTQNGKIKFGLNKKNESEQEVYFLNGNVTSTDNNIIYVHLKKGGDTRYIKLNNYNIVKDEESESYKYYLNGEEKLGLLKFELVDSQGLLVENAVVTDETITASGISLNRITGEISGTISDKIYVKIYVKDDVYNTSEKYILIISSEF